MPMPMHPASSCLFHRTLDRLWQGKNTHLSNQLREADDRIWDAEARAHLAEEGACLAEERARTAEVRAPCVCTVSTWRGVGVRGDFVANKPVS